MAVARLPTLLAAALVFLGASSVTHATSAAEYTGPECPYPCLPPPIPGSTNPALPTTPPPPQPGLPGWFPPSSWTGRYPAPPPPNPIMPYFPYYWRTSNSACLLKGGLLQWTAVLSASMLAHWLLLR